MNLWQWPEFGANKGFGKEAAGESIGDPGLYSIMVW